MQPGLRGQRPLFPFHVAGGEGAGGAGGTSRTAGSISSSAWEDVRGIRGSLGASLPCPAPSRALEFGGVGALLFGGCSLGRSQRMLHPPSPGATAEGDGEEGCSSSSSSTLRGGEAPGPGCCIEPPRAHPLLAGLWFGVPHFCSPISGPPFLHRGRSPGSPSSGSAPLEQRHNFGVSEGCEALLWLLWRICTALHPRALYPARNSLCRGSRGVPAPPGAPPHPAGLGGVTVAVPGTPGGVGSVLGVLILPT